VGFATAYNFTEKLKNDELGQRNKRNVGLKKTIDLIGDYFGDISQRQKYSQIGQKMIYNKKDPVY
jgi:hypothetical protein